MIRVYDPGSRSLVEAAQLPNHGWLHVHLPTARDFELLQGELQVPQEFLHHTTDVDELARLDDTNGSRLVVFRVPWKRASDSDLPYRTSAFSIILHGSLVISIALHTDEIVEDLLIREHPDHEDPHALLLRLLLRAAERFLIHLRRIDEAVNELEDQLRGSQANREVLALLRYQKSLVHFRTALASNQIMMERLQKHPGFAMDEAATDLLDKVLVETRQASEMTIVSSDILGQMMDAFASIISNNLNIVMRVLTALTIVLAIPTVISSFYGMNVALPWQTNKAAFLGIAAISVLLCGLLLWLFARRRWL